MMVNYKTLDDEQLEYVAVAGVDELGDGQRLFVEIDAFNIIVFNIAGEFFAIGDLCSHDDGPLGDGELEGYSVACPRHGARFDVRNGEVLSLPAATNIPAYPVRIVDGQIEIGIPVED